MDVLESPIDTQISNDIRNSAREGAELIGIPPQASSSLVVKSIDGFVRGLQKATNFAGDPWTDMSLPLGSLWGEQLSREFHWTWAYVDFGGPDSAKVTGVFSPDRSLAIYPFYFIYGCITNSARVTILLSFDMLKEDQGIHASLPNTYENVMDKVGFIIP